MTIYDFTVKDARGGDVNLADYKGKVLMIVNVASRCGFAPQYEGLEKLYNKYKDDGLAILAFPSNTFKEELDTNEEIQEFCRVNYGVTFPVLDKVEVNGEDAAPIYKFLKEQQPSEFIDVSKDHRLYDHFLKHHGEFWGIENISWNFNKFLFDRDGKLVGRYASPTTPEELDPKIEELL